MPESGVVPRELESRLRDLRRRIREAYDDQILKRVQVILTTCRTWNVEIIVFPEYSIPWEILGGIVDSAGPMVVVAGTHSVERDARNSGVYQKLGCEQLPGLGTAVCPVLHQGRLLTLQPKLNPAQLEVGSMQPGQTWHPVPLPPSIPGPLGVMICLDFLYREGERHRGLVGPGLEQCRFLAVPSLTPHFTIPEFTSKAWEEAKRYGRPVLYADIASGGGTSVFVDEGDVTDLRLFPERAGYLEPGDEGVIVADIDLGYERPGRSTRYEHEKPVKPFAAASLVYRAHPVGDRYANFLGALWANPAVDLETVLDELQAKRELLLDAGALPGARMRERRMRRMLGELGYTTDLEDLRTFTREIVLPPELLPPELLPLNPLRQALARGAADVVFDWLREGHRDGLEVVESRLRQAARSLENLDPASWTADGLRGLALVSEAVHEPPAPEKAAPLAGEEISFRVMLPEGLNPAMMGRQTYKDLILQFSASPGGLTWPTRGEEPEFDIEDRGRLVPGAWAFVAAIGLSEDLFLLGCQILHREGTTFALADPILADHLPPPLRIHHVSDLHVGPKTADSVDVKAQGTHGQALGQGAGAKPVRDVYLDHVSALPPHRKPHVVVISGDLAEMGDVELYRETQVWLDRLESLLAQHGHPGLADQEVGHALPRILLVGGNHDVNWKEVIGPAGARKRHLPFAQAFEKYPRPRLEEPPGSRPLAHVSYGAELGVEFLLLGSAEFGGQKEEDTVWDRLVNLLNEVRQETVAQIDQNQWDEVSKRLEHLSRIDPGLVHDDDLTRARKHEWRQPVRIAVLHHPVSPLPSTEVASYTGLINAGRVKDLLMEKRFCLVLHGHLHLGWFTAERWPGQHDDWTLHIAAAPTLGSRETQHALGYNVVEVAREGNRRFSVMVSRVSHDTGGGWPEKETMGPIELDFDGSRVTMKRPG